jgi:hypothetical protein
MSLVIIAFKNAPTPSPESKAKDEALDNEIRKKTIGKKRKHDRPSMLFFSIFFRNF